MKKLSGRTAFNAVYFFVAISCCAWFFLTYGLGSAAAIAVCTLGVLYGVLLGATLSERCLHRTLITPTALSKRCSRGIRAVCLILPVLPLSYIAAFYFVSLTYYWPGGISRFNDFNDVEEAIFHVAKAHAFIDAKVERTLAEYTTTTFSKWAKSHWHPLRYDDTGETICRFHVHKDGVIHDVRIHSSSGNADLDIDALVAMDGVAPPLPQGAPDWVPVEFTFAYNVHGKKPSAKDDPWGTNALNLGAGYRRDGKFGKAVEALSRSLDIRQAVMKDGDANLTDVHLELAQAYSSMGLMKKATYSFNDAIACAELGSNERPDYLTHVLIEYADRAYGTQHYDKVVSLYERIKSHSHQELPREDRVRFAQSLFVTGQHERALKEFAAVLKLDEADKQSWVYEQVDWERFTLIKLYLKEGERRKAMDLINSALAQANKSSKRKELRKDLLLGFGEIYSALDEKSERGYLQSTLAEFTANFGPLDPDTTFIRSQLASFEKKHGNHKKADELYSQLVNRYGKNDPDRANALYHQSDYYFGNGRNGDAERVLREALEIRTRLYKGDDSRVGSIKNGYVTVLRALGKTQEADALFKTLAASAYGNREDFYFDQINKYADSGKFDEALGILDQAISESLKKDPSDRDGSRNCNYDRAIELCRKSHNDKRLEQYLKDKYSSEVKRLGSASWHQLITFYLERNQLSKAEELAHKEVHECLNGHTDYFPQYRAEEAASAFIDLAKVKDLQGRKETARDYIDRAVTLVAPNGRSGRHTEVVGLLAQYCAADGDMDAAERLLKDLLKNELADTSGGVYFDPIGGFSTTGCSFSSQGGRPFSYTERGSKRCDPLLTAPQCFGPWKEEMIVAQVTPLAMSRVNWSAGESYESDFCYLKASALLALASFQETSGEQADANESRNQALDCVQHFIELCETVPNCRNYEPYNQVFDNLPQSERLEQLRARFVAVKSKKRFTDL